VDRLSHGSVLETMTKDEGKKLRIEHPGYYFRVFNGKANFAPPVEHSDWYRFNSIELANGDNIGVVCSWQHPGASDTTVMPSTIAAIKAAVGTAPRWRDYVTADMWVGKCIAPILNLDAEDGRAEVKKVIKQLIRDHHLAKVPGDDAHREERMFVVAAAGSAAGLQGAAGAEAQEPF